MLFKLLDHGLASTRILGFIHYTKGFLSTGYHATEAELGKSQPGRQGALRSASPLGAGAVQAPARETHHTSAGTSDSKLACCFLFFQAPPQCLLNSVLLLLLLTSSARPQPAGAAPVPMAIILARSADAAESRMGQWGMQRTKDPPPPRAGGT